MRNAVVVVIAVLVAVGIWLSGTSGSAADKVKPGQSVHVFDDPAWAAENGKVTFSHTEHQELFGQEKLDCKPCHMSKPPLFVMKRKPGVERQARTMKDMEQGLSCGGCHDGKMAINEKVASDVADPDGCAHCHKK